MRAEHFEILVEEPSMEAFLVELLPRLLGDKTFTIHAYQGKADLLGKLRSRLAAYAKWLPKNYRIVIVIDRDNNNCADLKARLEEDSIVSGLTTRSNGTNTACWRVANRIAIEELEAWFFGEWSSVRRAYPRVPATVVNKPAYRQCDSIMGGTWEALERILNRAGYFSGGLRKVEMAREIGKHFDHLVCVSPSFIAFRDVLTDAIG
jgi:hypothetical protein